jgi:hypothetical protein
MGLAVIGIEVDSQFAKGMALREDVDSERLLSVPLAGKVAPLVS